MRRILSGVTALLLAMAVALPACARKLPAGAVTDGAEFMPVYKNPTPGQMPILTWGAWAQDGAVTLADERFAELKEVGVNLINSFMGNAEQKDSIFVLAEKHGLKVMLHDWHFVDPDKAVEIVRKWRGRKALAGYMPMDEPTAPDFPKVRRMRDAIFTMDTTHIVLVNLLPVVPPRITKTASYQEYIDKSIDELELGLLSYDNYPVQKIDGRIEVRDTFYENLEIVSSSARRAGWPFWAFALVIGHYDYAPPVESDIRFEIFNALAYGAQGIQYYTYGYDNREGFNTTLAPLDKNGQRTSIWYGMKNVNAEIQNLNQVFLGCEVLNTGHLGTVPPGTGHLDRMPGPITSIKCGRQGVLVSEIRNQDRRYIVIVNHEPRRAQNVRLRFDGAMTRVSGDGTKSPANPGIYRLAPGGYLIFQY